MSKYFGVNVSCDIILGMVCNANILIYHRQLDTVRQRNFTHINTIVTHMQHYPLRQFFTDTEIKQKNKNNREKWLTFKKQKVKNQTHKNENKQKNNNK